MGTRDFNSGNFKNHWNTWIYDFEHSSSNFLVNSCIFDQSSKLSSSSSAIFELDKRNARIRSIYESMGGYRFDFFIELKSTTGLCFILQGWKIQLELLSPVQVFACVGFVTLLFWLQCNMFRPRIDEWRFISAGIAFSIQGALRYFGMAMAVLLINER